MSSDLYISLVQFSRSVVSDSLQPHGLQHARPPCPSPTPRVYSNSCPLSRWCHPTISSSVALLSSCLQSFPASGSFQMSQLFASGGQSITFPILCSVILCGKRKYNFCYSVLFQRVSTVAAFIFILFCFLMQSLENKLFKSREQKERSSRQKGLRDWGRQDLSSQEWLMREGNRKEERTINMISLGFIHVKI